MSEVTPPDDSNVGVPGGWYCEGYGREPAVARAWCYVSEPYTRSCADPAECHRVFAEAQRRDYRNLQQLAASGDKSWQEVAEAIARPDQLHTDGEEPGSARD